MLWILGSLVYLLTDLVWQGYTLIEGKKTNFSQQARQGCLLKSKQENKHWPKKLKNKKWAAQPSSALPH